MGFASKLAAAYSAEPTFAPLGVPPSFAVPPLPAGGPVVPPPPAVAAAGAGHMPVPAAAAAHAASASGPAFTVAQLEAHLAKIVTGKRLERLYNASALRAVAERLMRVNWTALAATTRLSMDVIIDLSALALFDVVLFCDDSGSMSFAEEGERITDLRSIVSKVAELTSLFDDDGIAVRFINSRTCGDHIISATQVNSLVDDVTFSGSTPLGEKLEERVLKPMVHEKLAAGTLTKPVVIYIITDGAPDSKPAVRNAITRANAAAVRAGIPGAVSFEFCQVGKDAAAEKYLGSLDEDADIGPIIDATSYIEKEQEQYLARGLALTPQMYLLKLMLGAVDPSYDAQDEA